MIAYRGQIPKKVIVDLLDGPLATVSDVVWSGGDLGGEEGWDYFGLSAMSQLSAMGIVVGTYTGQTLLMDGRNGYLLDQVTV